MTIYEIIFVVSFLLSITNSAIVVTELYKPYRAMSREKIYFSVCYGLILLGISWLVII